MRKSNPTEAAKSRRVARAGAATPGRAPGEAGSAAAGPEWGWWWGGLLALAALRAALAIQPAPALWGLHAQAFVAPLFGWPLWLAAGLALWPPAATPMAGFLSALARALERAPALAIGVAAAGATLVLAFPDRLFYVGDFLLRRGAVRAAESPAVLSPQAFPLDVLLHYTLPLRAIQAGWLDAVAASRAIGALDAALLAAAALLLARALPVGPPARAAAFAVAFFGGALALMTGESKAFAEMAVLATGFAACGLLAMPPVGAGESREDAARRDLALLGAGACLGVGFFLHRLTLGLLPAWLLLVGWRLMRGRTPLSRSIPGLLAIAVPLVALAVVAPRLWSTALSYDVRANFSGSGAGGAGGVLARVLAPLHLLDVGNQLLFLSPLALIALLACLASAGRSRSSAPAFERIWIASLALPAAAVLLLLQPPQGVIRDWEAYAPSAAAISAAAAWAAAHAIERSRRAWLAAAVVLATAVPTIQWLAHFADRDRGLARLEVLMAGPPARPAEDRATTWNFIGWAHFRDQDFAGAARAFERACEVAPSPRLLTDWAMAETMAGRAERALDLYARAVERDSTYRLGWTGLGVSAINTGRPEEAARAARALERLDPANPKTREIADWVRQWEASGGR